MIASETNIPSPLQVNLQSRVVSRTRGFFWLPLVSILALCFAIITATAGEVSSTDYLTPEELQTPKVTTGLSVTNYQYDIGMAWLKGDSAHKDPVEAVKWFRKSAEQGFAPAQLRLGVCYRKGDGVDKDPVEAVKWVRKAAEQGLDEAQERLGFYLCADRDPVEATIWFRKAAEQGSEEAQTELSTRLFMGEGVTKDNVEALKWLRKAAEQGGVRAQANLGGRYANGAGVEKDPVEAMKWLSMAAEKGHMFAESELGELLSSGSGLPKDMPAAYKWAILARVSRNPTAMLLMKRLESVMSKEDLQKGKRMAQEFLDRKRMELMESKVAPAKTAPR